MIWGSFCTTVNFPCFHPLSPYEPGLADQQSPFLYPHLFFQTQAQNQARQLRQLNSFVGLCPSRSTCVGKERQHRKQQSSSSSLQGLSCSLDPAKPEASSIPRSVISMNQHIPLFSRVGMPATCHKNCKMASNLNTWYIKLHTQFSWI